MQQFPRKRLKGRQIVMERQGEPADAHKEEGFACLLPEVAITLQVTLCYYAGYLPRKFAFFLSCLALRRQHHDLTFHQRVIRNSADHPAYCSLSCLWSTSSSGPLWASSGERVDFSSMWQYQQVWLCNEWRSFFIWILSGPQQFSQSICKELLQMSPCKVTTHFGRKLEGAKTIQEPGWEMIINFLSVSLLKEETIISLSTQQKERNPDTF